MSRWAALSLVNDVCLELMVRQCDDGQPALVRLTRDITKEAL